MAVVSDRKLARVRFPGSDEVKFYDADVTSHSEYYPFGMTSRSGTDGGDYRYKYQGSESDDEVKGSGNSYTTHFRMLDPRICRWLSIDPKATAWESPYVSMGNNPILNNDIFGDTFDPTTIYEGTESDIKAFEIWASSKSGRKFILDHAEKGFELKGKYVQDLSITATKDGKKHKKGIDIDFYFFGSDPDRAAIGDHPNRDPHYPPEGSTGISFSENRMQITINLYPSDFGMIQEGFQWPTGVEVPFFQRVSLLSRVRNIAHETNYHAQYFSDLYSSGIMTKNNWLKYNSSEVRHDRGYEGTDFYNNTGREVVNHAIGFLYGLPSNSSFLINYDAGRKKAVGNLAPRVYSNYLEVLDVLNKELNNPLTKGDIDEILQYGIPNN